MKSDRREYYDPLYETITFERGFPCARRFFGIDKEDELDPREILSTAEFCRLAYLRQAGLAWLLFPSATHTRFAHSIGCWWLARIAESRIKVHTEEGYFERVSLQTWLSQCGLREEFYLGALLHDVGHGPLSHVIEHNERFVAALQRSGVSVVDHGHRGVLLIEGAGPLAEMWKETFPSRYGEDSTALSNVGAFLAKARKKVCLPGVYYLMTGDREFLEKCDHEHRKALPVVKEMVSGLIDIDRLDHAARDSYFSGLRQLVVNVSGLLSNLRIFPPTTERSQPKWSLTTDGASHVASLLFNRRQLMTTMFRNPSYKSLSAMVNWALSNFLQELGSHSAETEESLRIALMEDDQFLDVLCNSRMAGCRTLSQYVRNAKPYFFVDKWSNAEIGPERSVKEDLTEFERAKLRNGCPDVIVYYDEMFWNKDFPSRMTDWLNADEFLVEGTNSSLTEHPDFKADFDHLKDARRTRYLWVFARKHNDINEIRRSIDDIVRKRKRRKEDQNDQQDE